jgi:hypothetical protein
VPGVLGLTDPIDDAAGFAISADSQPLDRAQLAQVNAFGFGGLNAVAVLEQVDPDLIDGPGAAADPQPPRPDVRDADIIGVGAILPAHGVFCAADLDHPGEPADFDPAAILGTKRLRFKDRATLLATAVVAQAVADAGTDAFGDDARVGLIVASCYGNVDTVCRVAAEIEQGGVPSISPMELPNASGNIVCSTLAIKYGWRGVNLTITSGADSGARAMDTAVDLLVAGRCHTVVVVSVESANAYERAIREGLPLLDGAVCAILTRPKSVGHQRLRRDTEGPGDGGSVPDRFAGFEPAALATVLPVVTAAARTRPDGDTVPAVGGGHWRVTRC